MYGSGTKNIRGGSATGYATLNNGTRISATMTVSVTPSTFSFPGSVIITPTLSGRGSGAKFDLFNLWHVEWGCEEINYRNTDNNPTSFEITLNYNSEISGDTLYFIPLAFNVHYTVSYDSDYPNSINVNSDVTGFFEAQPGVWYPVFVRSGKYNNFYEDDYRNEWVILGNFYYQVEVDGVTEYRPCGSANVPKNYCTPNYEVITEEGTLIY